MSSEALTELATPEDVKAVSRRLLLSILAILLVIGVMFWIFLDDREGVTLPAVLLFGAMGAFISLQRRLKQLSRDDIWLIRESLVYTWLAPISGAVLAGILYLLFIAGLLSGEFFPNFSLDDDSDAKGIAVLFYISSDDPIDYAKLLVWSFIAGFSEKFVTNIIGSFQAGTKT